MLDVIRTLWTGEVAEHHGAHYDLPPLEVRPAPSEPVPVWVGGTSEAALRRAARNDGWISDLHTTDELCAIRARIDGFRREYGRDHLPFAMVGASNDAADLDGYRRMADAGVTHLMTWPWSSTPAWTPRGSRSSMASGASPTTSSPAGEVAGRGSLPCEAVTGPGPRTRTSM
jgi:alkanesulfonate monooxygenase SsuD/methylene tetrahydromethanopterin reductase-like flavin-dependent oxidoreductase (luciferase family)